MALNSVMYKYVSQFQCSVQGTIKETVLDGAIPSPYKIIFKNIALHGYLPDLFWDFTPHQAVQFSAPLFIISEARKAGSV